MNTSTNFGSIKPWHKIEELSLDSMTTERLVEYFFANENLCYEHLSTKTGNPTGLRILRDVVVNSKEMQQLNDRINPEFFKSGYYLGNLGVSRHIDGMRTAAILFELRNPENIGTTFHWHDHEEILLYDATYMINVKHEHSVQKSKSFRLFYQIELSDENSFDFYVDQHQQGNLISS